jgi:hypothetical protein
VDQIVETLYGRVTKPPLAPPPGFAVAPGGIPNRTTQQATVLKICCDLALEAQDRFGLMTDDAIARGEALGLTAEQVVDAATALVELYDLEPSPVLAEIPPHYSITIHGFIRCVSELLPEYKDVYHAVASAIVNEKKSTNEEVAVAVGANILLVEQILELMADKRFIHLEKCIGRHWYISNVSPRLKDVLSGAKLFAGADFGPAFDTLTCTLFAWAEAAQLETLGFRDRVTLELQSHSHQRPVRRS